MSQSTRHIMMMEPAAFGPNPQTRTTNSFQHAADDALADTIHQRAVNEFRAFRDRLVEQGIWVTTARGVRECPDDIFCNNWISTHPGKKMVLYPMQAPNRRTERRADLLEWLSGHYATEADFSPQEAQDRFLESTGCLAQDRVNKRVYFARSARGDEGLARQWAEIMGYELIAFDTQGPERKPIYHTDVLLWIGTGVAGICAEVIADDDRDRVLGALRETHDVVILDYDELLHFCGNALELRGTDAQLYLVMSEAAAGALRPENRDLILQHVDAIVSSDLTTIEYYGGGSARCMLLELF